MDALRHFGEAWLKRVQSSARPLLLAPGPEVPERAAAAASLARRIANLPPHERLALPSGASGAARAGEGEGDLAAFLPIRPWGEQAEEIDERYYEEECDPVRLLLETLSQDGSPTLKDLGVQSGKRLLQLDVITERLSHQVMEHYEEMVRGMELVTELEKDLRVVNIIVKNGRRHLASAMHDVTKDLKVAATIRRKQALLDTVPLLRKMQHTVRTTAQLDAHLDNREFAKALRMCTRCLILIDGCSDLAAMQEVSRGLEEWLSRAVEKVDSVLMESCRHFDPAAFGTVAEAYAVMDDPGGLADKIQTYFSQLVLSDTHNVVMDVLEKVPGAAAGSAQKRSRLAYSDLCAALPEAAFRECLHRTLEALFDLFSSYHSIMSWQPPKVPPSSVARSPAVLRRAGSTTSLQTVPSATSLNSPGTEDPSFRALSPATRSPLPARDPAGAGPQQEGAATLATPPQTDLPSGASGAPHQPEEAASAREPANGVHGGPKQAAEVAGSSPHLTPRERRRASSFSAPGSLQELAAATALAEDPEIPAGGAVHAAEPSAQRRLLPEDAPGLSMPTTRASERSLSFGRNGGSGGAGPPLSAVAAAVAKWEEVIAAQMQKDSPPRRAAASTPGYSPRRTPSMDFFQLTPRSTRLHPLASDSDPASDAGPGAGPSMAERWGDGNGQLATPAAAGATFEGDLGAGYWGLGAEGEAAPSGSSLPTVEAVRGLLLKGRKGLWELAARRVAALLACEALSNSSAHSFLQALELVQKFILAGELFSGAEAVSLRASLAKQSEKHFRTFHRQNLEVLKMMLERETWQRVPDSAAKSARLAELTGHGGPMLTALASQPAAYLQRRAGDGGAAGAPRGDPGDAKSSFADWISGGNPFSSDKVPAAPQHARSALGNGGVARVASSRDLNGDARERGGGEPTSVSGHAAAQVPLRQLGSIQAEAAADLDDDAEDEELLADFIDEESQRPARARRAAGAGHVAAAGRGKVHSAPVGEGGDGGPSLTSSCLSIVRFMERYARLMQMLQPAAAEVFKGLCQLFELYLITIFRIFGHRNALAHSRPGNDNPTTAILTPRLRATVVRIYQGLEEFRVKSGPAAAPGPGTSSSSSMVASVADILSSAGFAPSGDAGPGGMLPAALPAGGGPNQIVSSTNLYGLRERCVAVESILWLSDVMRRSRPRFQSLLPQSALPAMDHFFARTVDAVPDLREHVYRALARLLLNLYSYPDRIANVKWEVKDLGLEHNHYADHLLSELKLYAHRLAHAGISKQVQDVILEFGVDVLAEVLVEGFSRVKRCTNEGRALMSLDLQVLINGIAPLMPNKAKPNLQIVENYIKAFYLPETEYLHWARTHSEYTQSQILGLINLAAAMHNWKRKTRAEIIEKIESGDL